MNTRHSDSVQPSQCEHWWRFRGLDWRRCYFCGQRQQRSLSIFIGPWWALGPWITVEKGRVDAR